MESYFEIYFYVVGGFRLLKLKELLGKESVKKLNICVVWRFWEKKFGSFEEILNK